MKKFPVPHFKSDILPLVRLGLPLVGTAVAGFLVTMTDTLMLGWYNVTALAASTLAGSLWFILFILGAGFGFAVMPVVASAVAAGDETRARRVTRMALWLSAGFFLLVFPLLWFSRPVLDHIGQQPVVAQGVEAYLRIAGFGMLPALIVAVLRSYLSAQHLTGVLLWVTLGSVVLNAAMNWLLIFGNWGFPELGIRGAAIASVGVHVMSVVTLGFYAHWRSPEVRLYQRLWKPDTEALATVFRLGLPIGLTAVAEVGLFSVSATMMGWIGEIELAAHGVALQLAALTFMVHVGLSQAATIRAGGAYGRKDEEGLRRTATAAIFCSLSFAVLVVAIFVTMPVTLVSVFVDPAEPRAAEVIAIGVTLVMMAALFQLVDATQVVAVALLRGVQDTTVPMWLATFSYWVVALPAGYWLAFHANWGVIGVWSGLVIGLSVAALTLMARFWGRSVKIGAV